MSAGNDDPRGDHGARRINLCFYRSACVPTDNHETLVNSISDGLRVSNQRESVAFRFVLTPALMQRCCDCCLRCYGDRIVRWLASYLGCCVRTSAMQTRCSTRHGTYKSCGNNCRDVTEFVQIYIICSLCCARMRSSFSSYHRHTFAGVFTLKIYDRIFPMIQKSLLSKIGSLPKQKYFVSVC